ncbi:hypothetical protein G6F22_017364 [Rhizopus arrhizus]|nr:hypothetical protein G6F22_017364 [Rhizopus arrhizus]
MGILPLRLPEGVTPATLGVQSGARIEIDAPADTLAPRIAVPVRILRADGRVDALAATAAVETQLEVRFPPRPHERANQYRHENPGPDPAGPPARRLAPDRAEARRPAAAVAVSGQRRPGRAGAARHRGAQAQPRLLPAAGLRRPARGARRPGAAVRRRHRDAKLFQTGRRAAARRIAHAMQRGPKAGRSGGPATAGNSRP